MMSPRPLFPEPRDSTVYEKQYCIPSWSSKSWEIFVWWCINPRKFGLKSSLKCGWFLKFVQIYWLSCVHTTGLKASLEHLPKRPFGFMGALFNESGQLTVTWRTSNHIQSESAGLTQQSSWIILCFDSVKDDPPMTWNPSNKVIEISPKMG